MIWCVWEERRIGENMSHKRAVAPKNLQIVYHITLYHAIEPHDYHIELLLISVSNYCLLVPIILTYCLLVKISSNIYYSDI